MIGGNLNSGICMDASQWDIGVSYITCYDRSFDLKSDKILQQMRGGLETFKPFFLAFLGQKIHSCVFAKQLNFQFAALYGLFA